MLYTPLKHCFPIKPSWHPLEHTPLRWSHRSLFIQYPLQCWLQCNPNRPGEHFMQKWKIKKCIWYVISSNQLKSVNVCIKELVWIIKHQSKEIMFSKVYIRLSVHLPLLQKLSVYPGLHPLSQCPVRLLHGESSRQCPLQLLTQPKP